VCVAAAVVVVVVVVGGGGAPVQEADEPLHMPHTLPLVDPLAVIARCRCASLASGVDKHPM
jgi:hypothetical protein